VCGKNLNIVSMCAVSPVVYPSNISSCQKKKKDICSSEEYRCTHVDACVARTLISYRCVLCHPWCTHRTSLVVKKTFSVFLWLWTVPLR
jgi:hypothetical protein